MDFGALLLLSALLSSFSVAAASSSFPSTPSAALRQRRRLLQSGAARNPNIETFFPSNAVPAFSNPPAPPPPPPPPPTTLLPVAPPRSHRVNVVSAVVATAASTFVVSGLLFFALHCFAVKQRKVESYNGRKFQGVGGGGGGGGGPAAGRNLFRAPPVNGMLRAVVVEEEGLDVLYWRKVEDGNGKRCAHCMQATRGAAEESGGAGGRREQQASVRRGWRSRREDKRPVQEASLLSADSLGSSDRIKAVLEMEDDRSSRSSCIAGSRRASMEAVAPVVVPPSPPLPPPSGRRGPPSKSPSQASSSSSLPPQLTAAVPSSPPPASTKLVSVVAPPAPPSPPHTRQSRAPTPPPPAAKSSVPPPPAPPPATRPPPQGSKKAPAKPVLPPATGTGRFAPSPSRPPATPTAGNWSTRGEAQGAAKEPAKLKPLHWDKMTTVNAQHSMVWDKISDGSFRFDDDIMEALFGSVAANRKSPKTNSSTARGPVSSPAVGNAAAPVCLLDPRKSQNTAIVLKSLAVSRREILDALMEGGGGLSADTLEKLSKLAPSTEEEEAIVGFSGNPSSLADAESFLFHLLRAVPSAFARVDAMLFKAGYPPEVRRLREALQALEAACRELRRRGLFWKLLEAVLKAGNRMNAGTARGNAQAFDLAALCKLSDVKSTDGKTTLLHFVVESVVRSEGKRCVVNRNYSFGRSAAAAPPSTSPATTEAPSRAEKEAEYLTLGLPVVGGLSVEFANVKRAAGVDCDALANACASLASRAAQARRILAAGCGGGGGFVREMGEFLERAEEELAALGEEQARVLEVVRETTEYYYMVGAAREKGAPPLQLFVIVRDFLGMVDRACVDIARSAQQQKRAASVRGSPRTRPEKRAPTRFPNLPAHFMSENSRSSTSGGSDTEDEGF